MNKNIAKNSERGLLILQWLLFVSIVIFLFALPAMEGGAAEIYRRDPTKITLIISLIFVLGSAHAGFRVFALTKEQNSLADLSESMNGNGNIVSALGKHGAFHDNAAESSHIINYFRDLLAQPAERGVANERLDQILAEKINGQHESGWFVAGLLVKLGLVGTVIGFILMLSSVADISSLQLTQMQQVLTKMAVGISVALNTTLLGLIGNMALGVQYLALDRAADKLLAGAASLAETHFNSASN